MLMNRGAVRASLVIGGLLASMAQANLLEIVSTPLANSGPFQHNVFHSAESNGGTSGSILGWFDLDTSQTSTYDDATGEIDLYVNIFTDSSLSTQVGTAHGTSTLAGDPLAASEFNDYDDTVLGTINWNIELTSSGTFDTYMTSSFGAQPVGGWSTDVTYIDHNYVTSSAGRTANSWNSTTGTMTLWGADGTHRGDGLFDNSTLGTDVVFTVEEAPVPGSLLLAGFGLTGLGLIRRKVAKTA